MAERKRYLKRKQIVFINFEELEYKDLLDYKKTILIYYGSSAGWEKAYIFLDEIQKVPYFEKAVDSLYVNPDVDLYITDSNAYMLSGNLATLLTGKYVEIKMLTLSFSKFLAMTDLDPESRLSPYMKNGGMPYIAIMDRIDEKVDTYLKGICNTVIIKDIENRQSRKGRDPSKRKITDIPHLKTIAKYLDSVAGILHLLFSKTIRYRMKTDFEGKSQDVYR